MFTFSKVIIEFLANLGENQAKGRDNVRLIRLLLADALVL